MNVRYNRDDVGRKTILKCLNGLKTEAVATATQLIIVDGPYRTDRNVT